MLETIKLECQNYYNQIPANTFRAIGKSACFSFTVSIVLCNLNLQGKVNLVRPVLAAGTAALASTIHALTIPLFNKIFGENDFKFYKDLMNATLSLTLAHVCINAATPFKVNLISTLSPLDCFAILPSTLLKSVLQVTLKTLVFFGLEDAGVENRIERQFGIDLNANNTPIYFTA